MEIYRWAYFGRDPRDTYRHAFASTTIPTWSVREGVFTVYEFDNRELENMSYYWHRASLLEATLLGEVEL